MNREADTKPYVADDVGSIPVHSGGDIVAWARVDADLLDEFAKHRWHVRNGCAAAHIPSASDPAKTRLGYLHRLVMGFPGSGRKFGQEVAFKTGDQFDCRRANLRMVVQPSVTAPPTVAPSGVKPTTSPSPLACRVQSMPNSRPSWPSSPRSWHDVVRSTWRLVRDLRKLATSAASALATTREEQ